MYMVSGEDTRDYLRRVEHLFRSISVFKCGDRADLGITNAGQIITAANKLGDRIFVYDSYSQWYFWCLITKRIDGEGEFTVGSAL